MDLSAREGKTVRTHDEEHGWDYIGKVIKAISVPDGGTSKEPRYQKGFEVIEWESPKKKGTPEKPHKHELRLSYCDRENFQPRRQVILTPKLLGDLLNRAVDAEVLEIQMRKGRLEIRWGDKV
jgi:hypothetical protein